MKVIRSHKAYTADHYDYGGPHERQGGGDDGERRPGDQHEDDNSGRGGSGGQGQSGQGQGQGQGMGQGQGQGPRPGQGQGQEQEGQGQGQGGSGQGQDQDQDQNQDQQQNQGQGQGQGQGGGGPKEMHQYCFQVSFKNDLTSDEIDNKAFGIETGCDIAFREYIGNAGSIWFTREGNFNPDDPGSVALYSMVSNENAFVLIDSENELSPQQLANIQKQIRKNNNRILTGISKEPVWEDHPKGENEKGEDINIFDFLGVEEPNDNGYEPEGKPEDFRVVDADTVDKFLTDRAFRDQWPRTPLGQYDFRMCVFKDSADKTIANVLADHILPYSDFSNFCFNGSIFQNLDLNANNKEEAMSMSGLYFYNCSFEEVANKETPGNAGIKNWVFANAMFVHCRFLDCEFQKSNLAANLPGLIEAPMTFSYCEISNSQLTQNISKNDFESHMIFSDCSFLGAPGVPSPATYIESERVSLIRCDGTDLGKVTAQDITLKHNNFKLANEKPKLTTSYSQYQVSYQPNLGVHYDITDDDYTVKKQIDFKVPYKEGNNITIKDYLNFMKFWNEIRTLNSNGKIPQIEFMNPKRSGEPFVGFSNLTSSFADRYNPLGLNMQTMAEQIKNQWFWDHSLKDLTPDQKIIFLESVRTVVNNIDFDKLQIPEVSEQVRHLYKDYDSFDEAKRHEIDAEIKGNVQYKINDCMEKRAVLNKAISEAQKEIIHLHPDVKDKLTDVLKEDLDRDDR